MLWLVILVLIALGVWYLLGRLKQLEIEIRREIDQTSGVDAAEPEPVREPEDKPEPAPESPVAQDETPAVEASAEGIPAGNGLPLADRLLLLVAAEPGVRQPEIYSRLEEYPRKSLQSELLKLDRAGRLRREKAGGSYRLFLP